MSIRLIAQLALNRKATETTKKSKTSYSFTSVQLKDINSGYILCFAFRSSVELVYGRLFLSVAVGTCNITAEYEFRGSYLM